MLKRFDLTRGRHTGGTERGRDWAGGQFLSLRGDACGISVRDRKILACSREEKKIVSDGMLMLQDVQCT